MSERAWRATNVCATHNTLKQWSRTDILKWVNSLLKVELDKIEQLCTGAAYCNLMDMLFPGCVNLNKVKFISNQEYEFIENFRLLQKSFIAMKVKTPIPIEQLVKGRFQDNFAFSLWFRHFFMANYKEKCKDYDAPKARGHQTIAVGQAKVSAKSKKRSLTPNPEKLTTASTPGKLKRSHSELDIGSQSGHVLQQIEAEPDRNQAENPLPLSVEPEQSPVEDKADEQEPQETMKAEAADTPITPTELSKSNNAAAEPETAVMGKNKLGPDKTKHTALTKPTTRQAVPTTPLVRNAAQRPPMGDRRTSQIQPQPQLRRLAGGAKAPAMSQLPRLKQSMDSVKKSLHVTMKRSVTRMSSVLPKVPVQQTRLPSYRRAEAVQQQRAPSLARNLGQGIIKAKQVAGQLKSRLPIPMRLAKQPVPEQSDNLFCLLMKQPTIETFNLVTLVNATVKDRSAKPAPGKATQQKQLQRKRVTPPKRSQPKRTTVQQGGERSQSKIGCIDPIEVKRLTERAAGRLAQKKAAPAPAPIVMATNDDNADNGQDPDKTPRPSQRHASMQGLCISFPDTDSLSSLSDCDERAIPDEVAKRQNCQLNIYDDEVLEGELVDTSSGDDANSYYCWEQEQQKMELLMLRIERDVYFKKLLQIEKVSQAKPMVRVAQIQRILYELDDGFKVPCNRDRPVMSDSIPLNKKKKSKFQAIVADPVSGTSNKSGRPRKPKI
ncbi:uncharacterized protein LOC115629497 [Scaptodrosophila lebanonensis]|uniref:Uncharacterized protein LOC115629497 n=1 Tax=Drosophila lebanonensis TaxID=7225 RepID=A0A6J2U1R9_DROLE|nr:uncharacterized protein LOC115629497 [Scaptodrosophila lebanonensis]XP_030381835.1 uncharacterized protein LOC115629497 [Scaptodrosophila lebanonensis]XP_030381836.1 uncharacterized protein LOC115629497 [Scaptodrosophila lebanonensis]